MNLFSGQEIGKARTLQSEESRQNPSRSFWGRRKRRRRRNICEKNRKRSKRREWEFQGGREEEGVDVFWGDLVERLAWLAGICDVTDTHHTLCMLLGWQRICSRFYESKRNFGSAKYGKFIWAQGKRSPSVLGGCKLFWSFPRLPYPSPSFSFCFFLAKFSQIYFQNG